MRSEPCDANNTSFLGFAPYPAFCHLYSGNFGVFACASIDEYELDNRPEMTDGKQKLLIRSYYEKYYEVSYDDP